MKSIKILYNGQPLRNIYPHATRWQVIKYRTCRFVRKCVIGTVATGSLAGAAMIGGQFLPSETYTATSTPVIIDNLTPKIDNLKAKTLSTLKACESSGYSENDGIIIFDSNAKASIGLYQFQKATVIYYYKALYGKTITGKEAVLIALDDEKAGALAEDIIFKAGNGDKDWVNCFKKHKLAERVEIINELSK